MTSKRYVHRYVVPPIIATSLLLSPLLTTNVSAQTFYTVGDTGASVTSLQTDLQDYGYSLAIDGSFGPGTRSTVRKFQNDRGLQVDGIAGPNTLDALNSIGSGSNSSSVVYYSYGDTGSGVRDVQSDLNKHGFNTSVDGSYGPATRSTVRSFQRAKDLEVDGMAGPNTLKELEKSASNGGSSAIVYYSYGDTGSGVSDVQSDLNKHGFNTSVDGSYGPATRSTVRSFQSAMGLQVDGMAGPETLKALSEKASDDDNKGSHQGSGIVSTARDLVGSPYVFGGVTPSGFDSSGFINYVFSQHGINLQRTHAGMWANNGVKVGDPKPGDVVFYKNTYKSGVSHSGIYIGNGKMIHAGTKATGVEVQSINVNYWQSRYIGAKSFK